MVLIENGTIPSLVRNAGDPIESNGEDIDVDSDGTKTSSVSADEAVKSQENGAEDNEGEKPDDTLENADASTKHNLSTECGLEFANDQAVKAAPPTGRGVSLEMLLRDSVIRPGTAVLSVEVEGKCYKAHLFKDGSTQDKETEKMHDSATAWAIWKLRSVDPNFKPPDGLSWCSQLLYKGKDLEHYKKLWFEMKKNAHLKGESDNSSGFGKRQVIRHESLGLRYNNEVDSNLLVKCYPFSRIGKLQPFNVSLSVGAFFMIDLHSSLTTTEVTGYLGGTWDVNSHTLSIKAAFPCCCPFGDSENAPLVEYDIACAMQEANYTLVGWYHSHPKYSPYPSIPDIDAQLDYQIKMKGSSDASYIPCVGIITTPFSNDSSSLETMFSCYWVVPPPESRPLEYPCPMLMEYSASPDPPLSQKDLKDTKLLLDYYRSSEICVDMSSLYRDEQTYWDKMEASLKPKLMQDSENGAKIWELLEETFLTHRDDDSIVSADRVRNQSTSEDGEVSKKEKSVKTEITVAVKEEIVAEEPKVEVMNENSEKMDESVQIPLKTETADELFENPVEQNPEVEKSEAVDDVHEESHEENKFKAEAEEIVLETDCKPVSPDALVDR